MADETFNIGIAVGVQSALGTVNSTIAGLSGALGVSDGIILGDRESGDAQSGITIPNIERIARAVADVSGSFTQQFDSFLRAAVNSLQVTWQGKGNGATATPAAGEAKPDAGSDAMLQMAGLVGANGTSPIYNYTPVSSTVYGTVKLWVADLSFVFQDCLLESLAMDYGPGGIILFTGNIAVGSHDPATQFADGVTFPTFTYGKQASLSAPVVEAAASSWGTTRGFSELNVTISNTIEDIPDSNQDNGIRKSQSAREIQASGTVFVDTADSDFEYQQAVTTVEPTADLTFTVGTPAGATDIINAIKPTLSNILLSSYKANRLGSVMAVEFDGKCTGTTAGSEFTLSFL